MDLGLREKVVLVTAASGGLGVVIAEEFALEGATVIVSARHPERLATAVAGIVERTGASVHGMVADMTDAAAVTDMVRNTETHFGGIDVLVNNSGGAATAPFAEMSDEQWRTAMEVKVIAQIRCAREVFNAMVRRGAGGRILFIAGSHGRQPHAHAISAGVCNAALQNVSKGLAEDGGLHDVLCNVVNPGPFATDRMVYLAQRKSIDERMSVEQATAVLTQETVLKRFGDPRELAAFVVFLASARASYCTGAMYDVDGGQVKAL